MQTKNTNTMKATLKIGQKIESYFGNGSFIGIKTVTRVSESSCWISSKNCTYRESWNTVNNMIEKGLYKLIK